MVPLQEILSLCSAGRWRKDSLCIALIPPQMDYFDWHLFNLCKEAELHWIRMCYCHSLMLNKHKAAEEGSIKWDTIRGHLLLLQFLSQDRFNFFFCCLSCNGRQLEIPSLSLLNCMSTTGSIIMVIESPTVAHPFSCPSFHLCVSLRPQRSTTGNPIAGAAGP